ncbi:Por secretion system C-terminal sorting domain-containing protein [Arenibacter nanhaiticus]|uniref:Por secretion system C-terminal sorting domain-containing protein n=1 Tax=Arenibacter nanhaiticus TaxID=558155 RepID=A0A1M6KBG3_9FLAO|nr:zinc-dependent metalloprotease family protein [Arenibacter nanhaiticus]SHJ56281.1 Por secretion system C-terminal sorting domain-containing protein [Arenibacter nanhaiticus]
MVVKLRLVFAISIFFLSYYGSAQINYWQKDLSKSATSALKTTHLRAQSATLYSLNKGLFAQALTPSTNAKSSMTVVNFPNEEGVLVPFRVRETPVLSPALALKYPEIKSYSGRGLHQKDDRIRFSVSPNGVQSMIIHADGKRTTYMQKTSNEREEYMVYTRDDSFSADIDFICATSTAIDTYKGPSTYKLVDDQVIRKFRLAISATGEYVNYHGGTVASALGAINATLTRVNEIFETDLGISLELVANTDQVIYTDENTDPYGTNLNTEVQNTLTNVIGAQNYDVGHLFHKNENGGNAGFIGSVCVDNRKGSAYSAALEPEGDMFDLEYVAHELGHQFGANHSWSFESEGTLVQTEPGSGSTIMGYAGVAGINNVATNGDNYFHYNSIDQIQEYLKTISCGVTEPIANRPPGIVPTGNFIIPKSTAFALTATATDEDTNDILTYNWEQVNNGIVTSNSFGPTNLSGANFRSLKPTVNATRYFPMISSILSGNLTQTNPNVNSTWETVSSVARDLDFALTVRDNAVGGGQVASDLVQVRVINEAGPFRVSSQATQELYSAGSVQEVVWEVANTNQTPINAQKVDIFLSTDPNLPFSIPLAEGVPNDGRHQILIPAIPSSMARIMVKAQDNIFLAVNASDFTIVPSDIVVEFNTLDYEVCQGDDLVVPFNYNTFNGFNEEATFSATGAPAGLNILFSQPTATENNTAVTVTFSDTDLVAPGMYTITVVATTASTTKEVPLTVRILDPVFTDVQLLLPENGSTDTSVKPVLEWEATPSFTSFDIEIANDNAFTDIIETATLNFTSYRPTNLVENNVYFWRVKPSNLCGEGTFGPAYSFTTQVINCAYLPARDLPKTISTIGTPTVTSTISVLNDLPVADLNVSMDITHSYISDLEITLISPIGTRVVLISNSCGDNRDVFATFDDDAAPFICGNRPALSGIVKPLGSLSVFNGESTQGDWTLEVKDMSSSDGGTINAFYLDICAAGEFRPDNDNDGVFDDGDDLCLGTPPNTTVDLTGCPLYIFPSDNFEVAVTSEACRNNNDGSINITANQSLDYELTIIGNGINATVNFTNSYLIPNLSSGNYDVCITATDGAKTYEAYCFSANIKEPEPLRVSSSLSLDGKLLTLNMEGATEYLVELNGETTLTGSPIVTLDLKKGINVLKVSTNLPCQGIYEDRLFLWGHPIIHPNPFENEVSLAVPNAPNNLQIGIFTAQGQLISHKLYVAIDNEFKIDFTGFPSGLYFLKVEDAGIRGTFKVIKK